MVRPASFIVTILTVTLLLSAGLFASMADASPQEPIDASADFYVAPNGNNAWSGRLAQPNAEGTDGPLATPAAARDAVRKLKAQRAADGTPAAPIRVLLRQGYYFLPETLVFTPDDGGTAEAAITYAAYPGEQPVLSGGRPIEGAWWTLEDACMMKDLAEDKDADWDFRQLFVDGRRASPARMPAEGYFTAAGPGVSKDDRAAARRDPETKVSIVVREEDRPVFAEMSAAEKQRAVVVVFHSWTASRHRIKSFDPETGLLTFTAPSNWPMDYWEKNPRYYVEFVDKESLGAGQWCMDRDAGRIAYRPSENQPGPAEFIAPRLETLVVLDGSPGEGRTVDHLRFDGLSFQHTAWRMPEAEPVDGQAAAFLDTAAVVFRGARHCALSRCEVAHTGGYGAWLREGTKDCRLEQCHLHDLGAGGVRLGEMSLPELPERQAERNEVVNCLIHGGGRVFHAGVGVWIGRSSHNRVVHNEICDFYYTGVSVGWSWGYAPSSAHHNLIAHNRIHHLGWGELSDMGGIYCLGISPGTVLRGNRIHDVLSHLYGGWGLYTDEGSTGIVMEDNVVYRVKDGAFHQHYGRENIVRNNILGFSALRGQIIRSREEDHNSFTIERNIIVVAPAPPLGGNWTNDNYTLRENLYFRPDGGSLEFPGGRDLAAWQEAGHDRGSVAADPGFRNLAEFDFQLSDESPARKIGFQPIDMTQAGPTGPPEWRAKAAEVRNALPAMPMPEKQ